ncbi:BatA domain-containing protein [Thermomonas brevis]|uniref:BatA domain-containing protein n=1 Tax=Thermomonas brevis TaxID=215691 RepID=A0A7G9QTZ0_9GAMM|nr:BatA domain-containing protein [Thermomonas brevis]QNN46815.1 BatA domain-containing protein [Thermomonas brevis]
MSLGLLLPMALAALGALLLPLLLHLARRGESRTTDFAALRWLRATPRPRRRLRFEEWPLLLVRLLLLALLALWLARPVLYGAPDRRPFVAIMPGVDAAAIAAQPLPADARRHWLAAGLPDLTASRPIAPQPIASLLREIDASLAQDVPLIVLATAQFEGADAQLPRLSRNVDWRIVAETPPPPAAPETHAPRLYLQADPAHAPSLRYFQAAARAWRSEARSLAEDEPLPATDATIIRLASGSLPATLLDWIERGGTVLASSDALLPGSLKTVPLPSEETGTPLAEGGALGRGRLLRFLRPVQPSDMPLLLESRFPRRLQELLQPARQAPTYADARAYAPIAGARSHPQPPRELQPWLALLAALLFAIERWLATRARRAVPA